MKPQLLQRLARIVGGDANPLRRPVDRIESAIITGLVVAFVVAAPLLGLFAGRVAHASSVREQRAERSWREVPAVLNQSAADGMVGADGEWDTSWVRAHWRYPGGPERTGLIAVALNSRKGQRVQVWVTPAGQLTHPRLSSADLSDRAALAAVSVTAGLLVVLAVLGSIVRVAADRCRMTAWAREWEATGPRWSSLR